MSFHPHEHVEVDLDKGHKESAGPDEHDRNLLSKIHHGLERASIIQEKLSGLRENLIVERERVRLSASTLRAQRIKTGDAEAALMSALRQFFNERRDELPPHLAAAYDQVELCRDKLGPMEQDYLEAESTLGGSEWTFIDKENDVYQFELLEIFRNLYSINSPPAITMPLLKGPPMRPPLPPPPSPPPFQFQLSGFGRQEKSISWPPPPPPPPPPHPDHELPQSRHTIMPPPPPPPPPPPLLHPVFDAIKDCQAAKTELDAFKRQFEGLRMERSASLDMSHLPLENDNDISSNSSELLNDLFESEIKLQRLRSQQPAACIERRNSDPSRFGNTISTRYPHPFKAHTDSGIQTLVGDLTTLRNIRGWLLDCLENNVIERTLYLNILEDFGIADRQNKWQKLASQYWNDDSDDEPPLPKWDFNSTARRINPVHVTDNFRRFEDGNSDWMPSSTKSMPYPPSGHNCRQPPQSAPAPWSENRLLNYDSILPTPEPITPPSGPPQHLLGRTPVKTVTADDIGTTSNFSKGSTNTNLPVNICPEIEIDPNNQLNHQVLRTEPREELDTLDATLMDSRSDFMDPHQSTPLEDVSRSAALVHSPGAHKRSHSVQHNVENKPRHIRTSSNQ